MSNQTEHHSVNWQTKRNRYLWDSLDSETSGKSGRHPPRPSGNRYKPNSNPSNSKHRNKIQKKANIYEKQ